MRLDGGFWNTGSRELLPKRIEKGNVVSKGILEMKIPADIPEAEVAH